jgi:hypothetical protein
LNKIILCGPLGVEWEKGFLTHNATYWGFRQAYIKAGLRSGAWLGPGSNNNLSIKQITRSQTSIFELSLRNIIKNTSPKNHQLDAKAEHMWARINIHKIGQTRCVEAVRPTGHSNPNCIKSYAFYIKLVAMNSYLFSFGLVTNVPNVLCVLITSQINS